tara:strand:- start:510 stop:779 length:270 start_codon:yes stop_codon:yes gene_type:complete
MITMKKYQEIKNKQYTMVSYNPKTMVRAGTYTADMVKLMDYQMLRPDLGHIVMEKSTYDCIPFDNKYGDTTDDLYVIMDIAFEHRPKNW